MTTLKSIGLCLTAATLAVGLATLPVYAQQATTAPATQTAPKLQPASPPKTTAQTTPAAPITSTTPATAAPAAPKKKKVASTTPSACKGLDEAACTANAECQYITPKKATSTTGVALKPYCRSKPKPKTTAAAAPGTPSTTTTTAPAAGAAPVQKKTP